MQAWRWFWRVALQRAVQKSFFVQILEISLPKSSKSGIKTHTQTMGESKDDALVLCLALRSFVPPLPSSQNLLLAQFYLSS
jgi:hypothetical protein